MFGHNLTVQLWSPHFDPSNPFPISIVSWIRIPNLPSALYHKPILEEVGAIIGKVVRIDEKTLNATRGRFARMAVTIDLTKPLITRIRINGKVKVVEYESLSVVCFNCGIYGHLKGNCPRLNESVTVNPMEQVPAEKPVVEAPPTKEELVMKDPFGPWILVEPRKRKQNLDKKVSGNQARNHDTNGKDLAAKNIKEKKGNEGDKILVKKATTNDKSGTDLVRSKGKELAVANPFEGIDLNSIPGLDKTIFNGFGQVGSSGSKAGQGLENGLITERNKTSQGPDVGAGKRTAKRASSGPKVYQARSKITVGSKSQQQ